MRAFAYERPTTLAHAIVLLEQHGSDARVLAGGTDLIIRMRDGTYEPALVLDVKGIPELAAGIAQTDGSLRISAATVMSDVAADARVGMHFPALAAAANVVGSVQIRNRATLAGNICNASPAADTAPPLLVYGAQVVVHGPRGERRVALDDFLVRSGVTTLAPAELVTAIELPLPTGRVGAAFARRTRRRGHDLASVTLAVALHESGSIRLAFGSLGPKPLLFEGQAGHEDDLLDRALAAASPSPTSLRAGPEYRVAMLAVLARRALDAARRAMAGA